MLARYSFVLKVAAIVLAVFAVAALVTLPARSYTYALDGSSDTRGFEGFSGTEKHPDGYQFAWGLNEPSLRFIHVPRYAPLNLRFKVNLQRPEGTPPGRVEIYEQTLEPPSEPRLVATLDYDPNNPGPHEYYLTIPARPEGGIGVLLDFKSNSFKPPKDSRQLGFMFLEAEMSLPRTQIIRLFWPYPFWIAGLMLLTALTAWLLRSGLDMLETLLMSGMAGFVIATMAASTYQNSWWLMLVAMAMWAAYYWERHRAGRGGKWSVWPVMAGTALLLLFFLFSADDYRSDIMSYHDWIRAVHENGVWNIYNYAWDKSLNYPPLIIYLIWFYNLIAYPLGLENSFIAWRVMASGLYLATIAIFYLIIRAMLDGKKANGVVEPETPPPSEKWLVLIAFNAAFFYNPTVWGQIDIMAVIGLVGSFYLIYRRQPLGAGVALGLTAISKTQAWFVLPVLVWMLVQRCGWRKALVGLMLGGGVALAMALVAIGFDPGAVNRFLEDPQLAGDYDNIHYGAFNLNYLLLGLNRVAPPIWLSLGGFGIVCAVGLLVIYSTAGRNRPVSRYGVAAALLGTACYTWLIKMKDRYLIFGLPFLGLAALQNRRLFKPFLLLGWLQLFPLVISVFTNYKVWKKHTLGDYPYLWGQILNAEWFRLTLSAATLVMFGYLFWLHLNQLRRPTPTEIETESQELVAR